MPRATFHCPLAERIPISDARYDAAYPMEFPGLRVLRAEAAFISLSETFMVLRDVASLDAAMALLRILDARLPPDLALLPRIWDIVFIGHTLRSPPVPGGFNERAPLAAHARRF